MLASVIVSPDPIEPQPSESEHPFVKAHGADLSNEPMTEAKMLTYHFNIEGINCANCSDYLLKYLLAKDPFKQFNLPIDDEDYIGSIRINPITKILSLEIQEMEEQRVLAIKKALIVAISEAAYRAKEVEEEIDAQVPVASVDEKNKVSFTNQLATTIKLKILSAKHWLLGATGLLTGITLLVLSLVLGPLPFVVLAPLAVSSILLTLALGAASYKNAITKLVASRQLTMDTLFALSTLTIIGVTIAAFFVPGLPFLLDAGLLIFGFQHLGKAIRNSLMGKFKLTAQFKDDAPKTVTSWDGKTILNTSDLQAGDDILILPGMVIPVDGICKSENSAVNEKRIKGLPLPRLIKAGEALLAGMKLTKDAKPLRMTVTLPVNQSHLARLDNEMEQIHTQKKEMDKKEKEISSKLLSYFIPSVMAIALISGIVVSCFFPPIIAIQCAVAVLVSACPCTLGLITAFAVNVATKKAAANGVIFKNREKWKQAAKIDTVIFDLNGTLTEDKPVVEKAVLNTPEMTMEELLDSAALLEKHSKHSFAKAIICYAETQGIEKNASAEVTKVNVDHYGISARLNGDDFLIGNEEILLRNGIKVPDKPELKLGEQLVYLIKNQHVMGYFILNSPLRKDAKKTIDTLIEEKIVRSVEDIHILTGTHKTLADQIANHLGIPTKNVHASQMSHHKREFIQQLQQKEKSQINGKIKKRKWVAMVGDYVNDSCAICNSDFGIVLETNGKSNKKVQALSAAVIQKGTLLPVVTALKIAKQASQNIKQNLGISLVYNVAAMLVASGLFLTLGIVIHPGIGVALMILQSTLVLLNTARFQHKPLTYTLKDSSPPDTPSTSSTQKIFEKMNFFNRINPSSGATTSPAAKPSAHLFTSRHSPLPCNNQERAPLHSPMST